MFVEKHAILFFLLYSGFLAPALFTLFGLRYGWKAGEKAGYEKGFQDGSREQAERLWATRG